MEALADRRLDAIDAAPVITRKRQAGLILFQRRRRLALLPRKRGKDPSVCAVRTGRRMRLSGGIPEGV